MKKKETVNKLMLNKLTIAHLETEQMKNAVGGTGTGLPTSDDNNNTIWVYNCRNPEQV